MKNRNNIFKSSILSLLVLMVTTISSYSSYAGIGNYKTNTDSITLNSYNVKYEKEARNIAWPAVLAVAGAVVLSATFAVGVIDGWNSVSGVVSNYDSYDTYDSNDFSNFDN